MELGRLKVDLLRFYVDGVSRSFVRGPVRV